MTASSAPTRGGGRSRFFIPCLERACISISGRRAEELALAVPVRLLLVGKTVPASATCGADLNAALRLAPPRRTFEDLMAFRASNL